MGVYTTLGVFYKRFTRIFIAWPIYSCTFLLVSEGTRPNKCRKFWISEDFLEVDHGGTK